MTRCENCGTNVPDNQTHCHICGFPISKRSNA